MLIGPVTLKMIFAVIFFMIYSIFDWRGFDFIFRSAIPFIILFSILLVVDILNMRVNGINLENSFFAILYTMAIVLIYCRRKQKGG
jgi:hypothetical protein